MLTSQRCLLCSFRPHVLQWRCTGPSRAGWCHGRKSRSGQRPCLPATAGRSDEPELAVFRFTLGIPGFDDANVPRVFGALSLLLLALNHVLGSSSPAPAQVRAEALGLLLAGLAIVTPGIELRLKELQPEQGRQASNEPLPGAKTTLALDDRLPEQAKQEVAWASFALLHNTNTCSVLVSHGGRALLARGSFAAAAVGSAGPQERLERLGQGLDAVLSSEASLRANSSRSGGAQQMLLTSKGEVDALGWAAAPPGCQSLLLQRFAVGSSGGGGAAGWMLLLSDRPRAWRQQEKLWVQAIADKLSAALSVAMPM